MNNKRFTFRITKKEDQEMVNEFLSKHEHLDFPSFIRTAVFDAIIVQQNERYEKAITEINEIQRAHGLQEI